MRLDDLPLGTMKMMKVGDRRLCVAHTADGVFAIDNACPHEGYGLVQGDLVGNTVTCAWHNWKFDVTTGECTLGEEDIAAHPVHVRPSG
jgi:nitrite reductase/ring-hydroxylating ferredoxin subunit